MKNIKKSERGQALILIVFAIIGLIGITGLTIDGGYAYSDRRNAQNAADTAALAAGRAMIREEDWENAAYTLAASNGYDNNGATNIVQVVHPPVSGTYAGDDEYIQVIITSHVQTSFARVVGITEMTNNVNAVARVIPTTSVNMYEGNAVVGLNPSTCKSVMYQGNANTTITGGGIFVNSSCPSAAFFNNSSSAKLTAPSLCSVGGITYEPNAINIPAENMLEGEENCTPYTFPVQEYVIDYPDCPTQAVKTGNTLSPGYYSGNKFPPNGVEILEPGAYCVNANFFVNGNESLTGNNVIIYMESGNVTWNATASINLSPPTEGPFKNLLLYVPYENQATVKINGNSSSTIAGTIMAPYSEIEVEGTGTSGINGQIIGYTVNISGNSGMSINYNSENSYKAQTPPYLQLSE